MELFLSLSIPIRAIWEGDRLRWQASCLVRTTALGPARFQWQRDFYVSSLPPALRLNYGDDPASLLESGGKSEHRDLGQQLNLARWIEDGLGRQNEHPARSAAFCPVHAFPEGDVQEADEGQRIAVLDLISSGFVGGVMTGTR
jgi:hypothetical protein